MIRSRRRSHCRRSCEFFVCKESAVSCSISPCVSAFPPFFDLDPFRHNGEPWSPTTRSFCILYSQASHHPIPSFFACLFANHLASRSLCFIPSFRFLLISFYSIFLYFSVFFTPCTCISVLFPRYHVGFAVALFFLSSSSFSSLCLVCSNFLC